MENTKDYGIPQNRERVFIVVIKKSLKKKFEWPKKKKNGVIKKICRLERYKKR